MIVPALLFICVFFTFFASIMFSGAEFAIGSVSRDSIEKLMENKIRGATQIYSIIRNKRRFRLMLLSGRIIAIVCGVLFLYSLANHLSSAGYGEYFQNWFAVFVISVFAFIVSEAVIARLFSIGEIEDTIPRFAYFLAVFHILLFPLTYLLDRILSAFIEKNQEMAAKEEALMELVKSESEAGVIEQEEKEMIQGVLDFSDTTVREVMVPRIDMIAIEKNIIVEELLALFNKEGHSRIPVYDGRIDSIIGVIYAKDILSIISEKGKDFLITETMRKPYFVHESKKISDLLTEFKKKKVHLAVVVDEYGGTAGIVALEDLLEEIVGDIQDEYDRDERDYLWINDRTVLMDAGLDIDDVNEIIHADITGEDFDTLGGFVYHQLGVIPEGGEEFSWEDKTFIVKQIDGNRISKVMVRMKTPLIKNREEKE